MSSFFTLLLIAVSLSMDAFSLALVYGLLLYSKKRKLLLSIIVGIYHFVMPLIGMTFGNLLEKINIISLDLVSFLILLYIGIDLMLSTLKKEDKISTNNFGLIIFGLSVSLDSLTLGIGLNSITNNYLLASTIFSITSLLFTYLGLNLGNVVGNKIGEYSKIVGGIVLIIIAIILFFY